MTNDYENQRRELRKVYFDVWQKMNNTKSLEPMEERIALIIQMHPEYHSILSQPDMLDNDFGSDTIESNPFYHMGLHISIHEQVGLDQPAGIQNLYYKLAQKYQEPHKIEHIMINCLVAVLEDGFNNMNDSKYIECLNLKI